MTADFFTSNIKFSAVCDSFIVKKLGIVSKNYFDNWQFSGRKSTFYLRCILDSHFIPSPQACEKFTPFDKAL